MFPVLEKFAMTQSTPLDICHATLPRELQAYLLLVALSSYAQIATPFKFYHVMVLA